MREVLSNQKKAEVRKNTKRDRERLTDLLTPPLRAHAERWDPFIILHQPEVRGMAAVPFVYEVPYSVSSLPDDLFDYCGTNGEPILLDTPEKIDLHMREFWPRHTQYLQRLMPGTKLEPGRNPYEWYDTWEDLYGRALGFDAFNDLSISLRSRMDTPIDPRDWHQYQQVADEQKRNGEYYLAYNASEMCRRDLSVFPATLEEGTGILLNELSGRNKTYLMTRNVSPFSPVNSIIKIPVGPFGSEHAENLLRSAWTQANLIEFDLRLKQDIEAVVTQGDNGEFLGNRTLRAYAQQFCFGARPRPTVLGTIATIHEGSLSNWSTVSEFTNTFQDNNPAGPDRIVHRSLQDGKVNSFARIAPVNQVGGVGNMGYFREGMIVAHGDSFSFDKSYVQIADRVNRINREQIYPVQYAVYVDGADPENFPPALAARTGETGCPFAFSPGKKSKQKQGNLSGIEIMSRTSGQIYTVLTQLIPSEYPLQFFATAGDVATAIKRYSMSG